MDNIAKTGSGDAADEPNAGAEIGQWKTRTCSVCGTKFSATEFCAVCLLRSASGDVSDSSETSERRFHSEQRPDEAKPTWVVSRFENYELMLDSEGRPIELGRGAMGVTYKATEVDLRRPVTLKVINERYLGDESARSRFLREARAAGKVHHPNVASIFHLGKSGEDYFYAMEFVEGETLENLIQRSGRLEAKLALEIARQVASGLAAIHKRKLVHRDIKPSNIMVSLQEGGSVTAKIIDLGLARAVDEPRRSIRDFNAWGFCRDSRVCQSRAVRGSPGRRPLGFVFAWRDALGDADRPAALPRHSR
jgi:tRNA A-37 threonylcarbamoyl transferase component Bud32